MVKQLLLRNIYAKKVVGTTNGKKAPSVLLPGKMGRILILRLSIGSPALWRNGNDERRELKTLEGGKSNENLVLGYVKSHYKIFKPWTNVLCWTNCDIGVINLNWNEFGWFLAGVGETDPQVEKMLSERLVTSWSVPCIQLRMPLHGLLASLSQH